MSEKQQVVDPEPGLESAFQQQGPSAPGRTTVSGRLGGNRPIILRVESAEAAQVFADRMFGPRDGNGVSAGAEEHVDRAAGSSGSPLPASLKDRFESSLGADLSSVRVHTGGDSAVAAEAVGARAYTVGNDIHFGEGQFRPDNADGMHLIAHEVAHTVQQAGQAPVRQHKLAVSTPGDASEVEADRAADAMVRGEVAKVGGGAATAIHRDLGHAPPPPPGMVILKNLQPVAAAVKAGEAGGGGAIPSPAGLFDTAQTNFNNAANHCTNVASHYHARAGGVSVPLIGELGANSNFASFAATAGKANAFCEQGAVTAGMASTGMSGLISLLQQSQDQWKEAKDAAEKMSIDTVQNKDGSTGFDKEATGEEGQQLQGLVKLVSPKDPGELPPDASPQQKQDHARRKQSSDEDIQSGKNMKSESKVLLDQATINFDQQVSAMNGARGKVSTTHGKAQASLLQSKVKANGERQKASEDDKAKIDEILGMVDKVQGAINKGRGIVNSADELGLLTGKGKAAMDIKASEVAKMVLQLDGTIPSIEGEIAACKNRGGNLSSIINEEEIKAVGKEFTAALADFKKALAGMPDAIKKYQDAHKAFAESANMALIKRGVIKPGDDGIKPQMELLGKLRTAAASTSAAVGAIGDVKENVAALSAMSSPPSPDVCQLANMVKSHSRAFGTAPGHLSAIEAVLKAREAAIKEHMEQMKI